MPTSLSITTGQRFSRLVVIRFIGMNHYGQLFECLCDCGRATQASLAMLKSGGKKSCGCLKTKHRMTNTPEFQAWTDLKRRCYDPSNPSYEYYGAKGVVVASEWINDFAAFYEHIGPRPGKGYSVDRYPNKTGNYEPGNVRWATIYEQNQNKSDNVWLTFHGETLLVKEWSLRFGIKADTLYWRKRQGWSDEEALTTPLHVRLRK